MQMPAHTCNAGLPVEAELPSVVAPDAPISIEVFINTKFPIGARQLHASLQVGRDFSTWIKDRIEKFQLVKDQDYIVSQSLSSPDLGSSKARPQLLMDYHLTRDVAAVLAANVNSERGRQVLRFLAEQSLKSEHPVELVELRAEMRSELQGLKDMMKSVVAQLVELRSKPMLTLENSAQLIAERDEAIAEKEVAQNYAEKLAEYNMLVKASTPLSAFLKHHKSFFGHGEHVGITYLIALGYLHKERVSDGHNTDKIVPSSDMAKAQHMSTDFSKCDKTKTKTKTKTVAEVDAAGNVITSEVVSPVLDSDGNQIEGTSNVVMLTPEGCKWLTNLLRTRPKLCCGAWCRRIR